MPTVVLRPLAASDRAAFVAGVRASRELHGDWVEPPSDDAGFDEYHARAASDSVEALVATRTEDGALVAAFNLSQIFRGGFQNAYLGFYAFAPYAGRGSTGAGLRATLDHAFGPLRLHRVEANVQPGNLRSRALVERVGFRHEGFSPRYLHIAGAWRDHERYAMTVEDWTGTA